MSGVEHVAMKGSSLFSLQWLLLISIHFSFLATGTASRFNFPRLSPFRRLHETDTVPVKIAFNEFVKVYFDQTLDHFTFSPESFTTFPQKYMATSKFWGGAKVNAPIFAYFGAESPLDEQIDYGSGFIADIASRFKALLVYMEHRYYGESMPFGTAEKSLKDPTTLKYFSTAQALADYAEIILFIKEQYKCKRCPVIVIGGSYGGMLATWFRLKYPHIALGALASSAPIYFIEGLMSTNRFFDVVAKDYREYNATCHKTIRDSWSEIDKIGSKPDGLSILTKKFKACRPLNSTKDLKDYLRYIFGVSAQYNNPPVYPLNMLCKAIEGQPQGTDILTKIFAGVVVRTKLQNPNASCYLDPPNEADPKTVAWKWQLCTEMAQEPLMNIKNNTMIEDTPFDRNKFIEECKNTYNITPQPHWIISNYGGYDLKLILQKFGSNIIFSNGLQDPYSSGGVLENISDTIVAIYTREGAHCTDLYPQKPETDPSWLVKQRKDEVAVIEKWIAKYNVDLKELKL